MEKGGLSRLGSRWALNNIDLSAGSKFVEG